MIMPIINQKNKRKALVIGGVLFCFLYGISGHLTYYSPKTFKLSFIDMHIPFMPVSIWIYQTQLLFLFLGIWMSPNDLKRTLTYYAMLLSTMVAVLFFLFMPIEMPRQLVPINGVSGLLWQILYLTDTPTNCFPSLHVALALLATYSLTDKSHYIRRWTPVWGILICISTLTTKQHYAVDVVGGGFLALFSLFFLKYLIKTEFFYENAHQ